MKQGWEIIPFEDSIVKVKYTTKIPSNDYLEQGLYPIVSQEEGLISGYWNNEEDVFKVPSPVVIFGDHTRILKFVDFDFVLGADGVKILQPIENINAKFFKLYLESCKIPSLGYSRHYKLLKELQIPIPPREEQERIVGILDREFEKIDALKDNAERNLQHAKDLFQSALKQELQPKEGWITKNISEISENLDYKRVPVTKKDRCIGVYPYYGASGIVDYVDGFLFDEDLLLVSEDGANLLARSTPIAFSVSGKIWVNNHAHILRFPNIELQRFVEYFFAGLDISEYVTGAAQPKFNQKALNSIMLTYPQKISEQRELVAHLDKLSENCKTLEENHIKTIALCDDMKQALLRKAFNGEL